uniref:Si:ch73-160i9.3 n=1 Tax=Tetraodon nigroviridis TaxID=99883 RepID=H3DLE2_TETNG
CARASASSSHPDLVFSSGTMSSNASVSPHVLKGQQAAEAVAGVILTLTVLLGTVGNSLVIWVAGFRLKANVTNVWLVNLAVADLIFCLTRGLSLAKKLFFDYWPYGAFVCKFNGFFKYANMFCSVFLLAVISLDRALCIWQPFLVKRRRTLPAARAVALGVWVAALVLSSPYFVYRRVSVGKNNRSKCAVGGVDDHSASKKALYVNRFLCGFLLPFVVILVCYVLAGVGLRRTRLSGKSRPLRILASLVTAFFLCWAPYHCLQMVKLVDENHVAVKVLSQVASAVAYFNSCINPLLYFCMGLQVKGRFRHSLTAVYKRALEDMVDRQMIQSNERSLDDSTTSKHSTT